MPTVDYLLNLPLDEFHKIVDREVRGQLDTETASLLRKPELSPRLYSTLSHMKSNVESQIAAKKSDLTKNHGEMSDSAFTKERSEFHKWKAGALRFRNGVDERLRQAKDARSSLFGSVYPDMIREERNSVIAENVRLKDAIRRHQEIVTNEYDPTEADEELWSVVGSNS